MAQTNSKKTGTAKKSRPAPERELEAFVPRSGARSTASGAAGRSSSGTVKKSASPAKRSGSAGTAKKSASSRSAASKAAPSRSAAARGGNAKSAASRSTSAKSGSVAKKAARNTRPALEKEARQPARPPEHLDEAIGVLFIALGIVMGIFTYTRTTALFGTVVGGLFGLFGMVQYAFPVLLALLGIVLIAVPRRQMGSGAIIMALGAVYFITCVIHLVTTEINGLRYAEYITEALELGRSGQGGGLLASLPSYWLAKFLSPTGAIVIFAALALALLLLATKVSIRSAGRRIVEKAETRAEYRRARREENERMGLAYPRRRLKNTNMRVGAEYDADSYFTKAGGDLKLVDGAEKLSGTRGRRSHVKTERMDLDSILKNAEPGREGEPSLDSFPKSGKFPYKTGRAHKNPVKEPDTVAYDPYETVDIAPPADISAETVEKRPTKEKPRIKRDAMTDKAEPKDDGAKAAEGEDISPAEPQMMVYQRPPITLLRSADRNEAIANDSPAEKAKLLIETLASFNISARVVNISVGPVITRFEIQPAQGVRVNRITSLSNDIALALAAPRVRIEAPIPGKAAVGIEIPNKDTAMVRLREVIDTREFSGAKSPLTFALGKDIAGKPVYADLERMPHMLIAGATGSGKSVCINSIILSTVYKSSPDEVRMILIDPKVVELSIFAPIPHLYCPVVTDPKKAAGVLKWACAEMDNRYAKMSKINARDLARFNSLQEKPEDRMPRLMIIIDELADLMIVSAKDVEESIARLAQLGRACGIHLIVATQRPSVDVITGLIKTNIPSRIAFAVSSAIDSRVILDGSGAEKLLGHGDMLFHPNGAAKPTRAQGAYVSDEEVENIMHFFEEHKIEVPQDEKVINYVPELTGSTGQGNGKQEDELLPDAVRIVMDSGSASISMIQRRLRVGYARAARLVDIMEQMKLVSGFDGSKPRKVLIDEAGYRELFGGGPVTIDPEADMVDVPFDTDE